MTNHSSPPWIPQGHKVIALGSDGAERVVAITLGEQAAANAQHIAMASNRVAMIQTKPTPMIEVALPPLRTNALIEAFRALADEAVRQFPMSDKNATDALINARGAISRAEVALVHESVVAPRSAVWPWIAGGVILGASIAGFFLGHSFGGC